MESDNIERDIAWDETSDPVDISYAPQIPKTPMSLFISITSRCNQACRHCAVYFDGFSYGPDLTTKQWLDFIDEIERLKILRVKISGGEPFVREDFYDILDALYDKPLRVSLNTNGTLIDEAGAKRLTRYRQKTDDIMVSLDGASPKSHDQLRGSGAFEAALSGIENLVRFGHDVSAYCTVTRLNFRELRAVAELASDTGISSLKFNYLLYEGRGLKYMDELKLNAHEIKGIVKELKEIRCDHPFISGTFFEMDEIFEGIRNIGQYDLGDFDLDTHFLSGCGALRNQCAIRPDGWAVPCDRLPEIKAGNILDTPLDIIWRESEAFVEFRKRFTTPITSLSTCGDCQYAPLCTAGCPASAYYTYGTLLARDPFCCYRLYSEELENGVG